MHLCRWDHTECTVYTECDVYCSTVTKTYITCTFTCSYTCSLAFSLQHSFFPFPPHSQLLSLPIALLAEVSWLMATSPTKTGKTSFTKPSFQALKSSSRPTDKSRKGLHCSYHIILYSNPLKVVYIQLPKSCSILWHMYSCSCIIIDQGNFAIGNSYMYKGVYSGTCV